MNNLISFAKRAAVFLASIAALWAALTAAAAIPNGALHENMLQSAVYFMDKDAFLDSGQMKLQQDNYADAILLNVTWNMGVGSPFTAALDTEYFDGNDGVNDYGENWGLYSTVAGMSEPNTDYTRYWHGSAAVIRPLLLLTDISGIKLLGVVTALVLLVGNAALLLKKKQFFAAGALLAAFMCVHFWNIRLSLEYQPAILVTLLVLPLFVLFYRNDSALSILAVLSGVTIAFFDFLTAETLTILIPLIVVFIMRKQDDVFPGLRDSFILTLKCGSAWLISYAGTFVAKWGLASAVTGENKFATALTSAEVRFVGEAETLSPAEQFFLAPAANLSTLFGGAERVDWTALVSGLIISALLLGAVFYLFRSRERFDRDFTLTMLILGALPFVRFFMLNNHSYLHEFFTYRALASSILAVLAILWFSVEFRSKKKNPPVKGGKKHGRA